MTIWSRISETSIRIPAIFHRPNQIGVVHWTWTASSTLVNDAYASGAADHVDINIDTSAGLYDRTKYGINYPYLFGSATKVIPNKIPTMQIANFGTLDGGPYPSSSGGIVYDLGDAVTKVWGNHTIKFGARGSMRARTTTTRSMSATPSGNDQQPERPLCLHGRSWRRWAPTSKSASRT